MNIQFLLMEALLIVTALSTDAFVSGFAYGANNIKIPLRSIWVINLVCSLLLAVSLFVGRAVGSFLAPSVTTAICFVILFLLGFSKIFDSAVKSFIRRHRGFQKRIRFSAFNLGFILSVYANPEEADQDQSRVLSPAEAAYLAVALSLDGLAVGFGAGIGSSAPLLVVVLSLCTDFLAVKLGCALGNKVAKKLSLDLSWLSGILLMLLAFLKVV